MKIRTVILALVSPLVLTSLAKAQFDPPPKISVLGAERVTRVNVGTGAGDLHRRVRLRLDRGLIHYSSLESSDLHAPRNLVQHGGFSRYLALQDRRTRTFACQIGSAAHRKVGTVGQKGGHEI